jgi:DNA invertase Pin-like site-specific DNA recombinase
MTLGIQRSGRRDIHTPKTEDPLKHAICNSRVAFMAAMAQAQAEADKQAQKAGIAHADRVTLRRAREVPGIKKL